MKNNSGAIKMFIKESLKQYDPMSDSDEYTYPTDDEVDEVFSNITELAPESHYIQMIEEAELNAANDSVLANPMASTHLGNKLTGLSIEGKKVKDIKRIKESGPSSIEDLRMIADQVQPDHSMHKSNQYDSEIIPK